MSTIGGAFSGLISFGVFQIHCGIPSWKFLFLIEGGATVLLSAFAVWWLPQTGDRCYLFNEAEKHVAKMRLLQDAGRPAVGEMVKMNTKQALRSLLDWRIMAWAVCAFCYGVAQNSVSNYMPQMVALLGYSTVRTNLLTVSPYCVGTVVLWCMCFSSDYLRERSFHLASALVMALMGFILLIAVDPFTHKNVAYCACFLLSSSFICTPIFHGFYSNNIVDETQRAATVGFMVGSANSAGIAANLAFTSNTAPRYLPALVVNCVFLATGIVMVVGMGLFLRLDNRRRDKLQGTVHILGDDVATQELAGGWNDPNWRWTV